MKISLAAMVVLTLGCAGGGKDIKSLSRNLLSPAEMPNWQLTAWRPNAEPWTLSAGVYAGSGRVTTGQDGPQCYATWVGHAEVLEDFVLECDFLYDGSGAGGIVLRGDRDARETWKVGYELDITRADDGEYGHLLFPVNPSSHTQQELLFEAGKWHSVRVEAIGQRIKVTLDGKDTMEITDAEFQRGQICLEDGPCEKEGHSGGHVKYRKLRIKEL